MAVLLDDACWVARFSYRAQMPCMLSTLAKASDPCGVTINIVKIVRNAKRVLKKLFSSIFCELPIVLIAYLLHASSRVLGKENQLWLISDRYFEARDNGFALFAHLKRHSPEVNAKFVLSSDAIDYDKVAAVGPVVNPSGIRYYRLLFKASKLITSDLGVVGAGPIMSRIVKSGRWKSKRVYLKHGVIAMMLAESHVKDTNYALYLAVSDREKEFLIQHTNLSTSAVQVLGLPRFDHLMESSDKIMSNEILFMPTWRRNLAPATRKHVSQQEVATFKESSYFHEFKKFLSSADLHSILEEFELKISYYLHHRFQPFYSIFEENYHPRIRILSPTSTDLQALLKDSRMLITDFSSVVFDAAYMKKPVIHFIPDGTDYYDHHISIPGYYQPFQEALGPVTNDSSLAVVLVREFVENNFSLPDKYESRIYSFFKHIDGNNCDRVVNAIVRLD